MWSGDFSWSRFEKAKQEWYKNQPEAVNRPAIDSKSPGDGYVKQKDSEETDSGFAEDGKANQQPVRYGKLQMLDLPGPKRGINDGRGPFMNALEKFVILTSTWMIDNLDMASVEKRNNIHDIRAPDRAHDPIHDPKLDSVAAGG